MPSDSDILFGRIAIQLGLLTKEQLDTAVALQEMEDKPRPLGSILVEKRYITGAELEQILAKQKANLSNVDDVTQKKKEDVLFGKVAIREGLATAEEVNDCLRDQAKLEEAGQFKRLGELMVERGTLTPAQVQRVLERQKRRIMVCRGCKARYNVPQLDEGKPIKCPRCGGEVVLPTQVDSIQVAGDFDANATQVLSVVPPKSPPPAVGAPPGPQPKAVPAPGATPPPLPAAGAAVPGVPTTRQVQTSRRPTVVMRAPLEPGSAGEKPAAGAAPASPTPPGGVPPPPKTPTTPIPAAQKTPTGPLPIVRPGAQGKAPTSVPPPAPAAATKTPTSVTRIAPAQDVMNTSGIMKVPAQAAGKKVDANCPICDHSFSAEVDRSTGRVKCPQCRTSFSP